MGDSLCPEGHVETWSAFGLRVHLFDGLVTANMVPKRINLHRWSIDVGT